MIKNQKQVGLVKERLQMLLTEKDTFFAEEGRSEAELLLAENSFDALIHDLKSELEEYEELTQGNLHIIQGRTLDELSRVLIGARIAQKITHKDLAERIGIQEQQIQRYEATDYESANLVRIREIAYALNIKAYFEKVIIIYNPPVFERPGDLSEQSIEDTELKIKKRGSLLCIE